MLPHKSEQEDRKQDKGAPGASARQPLKRFLQQQTDWNSSAAVLACVCSASSQLSDPPQIDAWACQSRPRAAN